MAETNEYFTIDKIVRNLLSLRGETTEHKKHIYLGHAKRFFDKHLRQKPDMFKKIRTVRLDVSNVRTVDLPGDYLDYVKVGVQIGDKVITLAFNENLARICPDPDAPVYNLTSYAYNSYPNEILGTRYPYVGLVDECGEVMGGVYGYGNGGNHGAFKIDTTCGKIIIDANLKIDKVYLEYVSYAVAADLDTAVSPYAVTALEFFILWQIELFRQNFGAAQQYENQYQSEWSICCMQTSNFGIEEFYNTVANYYSLAVNR